jgi:hypothetical protein
LRGAGHQILDEAVGRMRAEGGAAGFVDIVARLLAATFGEAEPRPAPESPSPLRGAARGGGDNERGPESGSPAAPARQEGEAAAPFPGTM